MRSFTLSPEVLAEVDAAVLHVARRDGLRSANASAWLDRVLREALGLPSRGAAVHARLVGVVAGLVEVADPARDPLALPRRAPTPEELALCRPARDALDAAELTRFVELDP